LKNEPTPSPLPDAIGSDGTTDWSKSYSGLSTQPFAKEIAEVLMAPLDPLDVEIKPGEHSQGSLYFYFSLSLCNFRWFTLPS
jgi:hypothetical protein